MKILVLKYIYTWDIYNIHIFMYISQNLQFAAYGQFVLVYNLFSLILIFNGEFMLAL